MSQWMKTKVETLSNIKSDFFFGALEQMGYSADFTTKKITRAYEGDAQDVDCVLNNADGTPANIGIKFTINSDETVNMEVVADWYYSHADAKGFVQNFTKEYNTIKYITVASEMGFQVEEQTELADGRRRLVLSRAA